MTKYPPDPTKATEKQLNDGIHSAEIDMFRWEFTCKTEAPYPLNYLPYSDNQQHKIMGIIVGMLIEKGMRI
jgi:hypothetical protein